MSRGEERAEGYDVARAIAIVLMVLINFQVFLLAPPSGADGEVALRWLAHLPGGRSSTLFVTLAGAGIALMSRRAARSGDPAEWRAVRLTLLYRALFLLVLGNLLRIVWYIDILHFYAFYLALASLLFLRASRRVLLASAGAITALGALLGALLRDVDLDVPYWSASGMAIDVLVDGIHPVVPWLAFVLFGMWLGQEDLGDLARRRALMLRAAIVWALSELVATGVGPIVATGVLPAALRDDVDLLSTGWSPSPLFMIAAAATATLFITLAHELALRAGRRRLVRALVATGQLSLSIYLLHALAGVGIPRWALGLENGIGIGALTLYWALFVVAIVVAAPIYRARLRRGPVEAVMRWITGAGRAAPAAGPAIVDSSVPAPEIAIDRPTSAPRSRAELATWAVIVVALLACVAVRLVGSSPPRLTCAPVETLGLEGRVHGELTLLCPNARFALEVTTPRAITVATESGVDLFLELRRGERIVVEDDDSGPGLDALATATLEPGVYAVTVRPYSGATGPFVLVVSGAPP